MQDGPPAVTSGKPKENSPVIFPEPSSALLSFGQTSIFLTQFSSQPQTSSQQRVQPKQQSPSPTSKAHPQPAHQGLSLAREGSKASAAGNLTLPRPHLGVFSPLKKVPPLPGPVPIRKAIFGGRLHPLPGNRVGSTSFLHPAPPEKPFELFFQAWPSNV